MKLHYLYAIQWGMAKATTYYQKLVENFHMPRYHIHLNLHLDFFVFQDYLMLKS